MGAGWVAGSVRARQLARHRLGIDRARAVIAQRARGLSDSAYADALARTTTVEEAQHAVWATALWDLRVLAGWLPPAGVAAMRTFAAYFEIDNIESQLVRLAGGEPQPVFDLGLLATAWPRVRDATSAHELRGALRRSAWRDPESDDRAHILSSLRLEWARRLEEIRGAAPWGAGAAALVLARRRASTIENLDADLTRRASQLGRDALHATSVRELVDALPDAARWVFDDVDVADLDLEGLWRAEATWWRRVDRDGERLLRRVQPGIDVVVGAVARRLADAWRTAAALDLATRTEASSEDLADVVA